MDQGNVLASAQQAMAQAPQPNLAPDNTAGQSGQPGLPPVPPQIALQLAQEAMKLPPLALGTLIYHALQQHGQAIQMNGVQGY